MTRIDAHQHFWRYAADTHGWIDDSMAALRQDFMPEHLLPELQAAGFDGSVAVQAAQTLDETDFLLGLAERYPWIRGVVGWVDLLDPGVSRTLERFAAHRVFVGVRHIVQAEPDDFMLRDDFRRGIAALAPFDFAYDVLIYARQLPAAVDLVQRFERQRFVIDHVAKPMIQSREIDSWAKGIRELSKRPNTWCKVSGLVTEADWAAWTVDDLRPYLDVVFEAFGPERLMVGSDWPVCTLAASHARAVGIIADYCLALSEAERDRVFGGSAACFYKL